jgi:hypothetical protein
MLAAAVVGAANLRVAAEAPGAPSGPVIVTAQTPPDASPPEEVTDKEATKSVSVRHEGVIDAAGNIVDKTTIVKTTPPDGKETVVRIETRPAEDAVWLPGYWLWDAAMGDYVWVPGVWRRAIPGATWHPGQWVKIPDGYEWSPGFWTRDVGPPAATSTTTTTTTTTTTAPIIAPEAPPAAKEEVRPAPPSADMIWVPGAWDYENGAYVWKSGLWELPPAQKMIWTPGRWLHTTEGYTFVPGHWDYPAESRVYVVTPE